MLSGTVCGLLLLYGGLAVALAMDAVPHLTLLKLAAVQQLVFLLTTYGTLVIVVLTATQIFYTSSLGTLARVVPCQQYFPAAISPLKPPT